MLLNELWDPHLNDLIKRSYQSLKHDNSAPNLASLRKTRLTLSQIKQLRMMNDARNLETLEKRAFLRKIYKFIPSKGL
jgi:hypothetical protein